MLLTIFALCLLTRLLFAARLVMRGRWNRSFVQGFIRAAYLAFGPRCYSYACPSAQIIAACDFPQFLVDQTPRFDEMIMEDIRPTDGWLYNVATGTTEMGTPIEITQDRFRSVFPNTTKTWTRTLANGPGCAGPYCDPTEHQIGWGADRLTYYAEQQSWSTPLLCYDQDMHITHAEQHIEQLISKILRPATTNISSNYLRKRHLLWSNRKLVANSSIGQTGSIGLFTYQWTLAGPNGDDEIYFDCSVSPANVYKLVPQMLQRRFTELMMRGYAGENPFKETSPFIELCTDIDTCWDLDHLGGQLGVGGGDLPNTASNWRFSEFSAADKYWRYGFSGQIGNFLTRVDMMGLRFNYVTNLGPGANGGNGNQYRYQVVLPYKNSITTGAGGSAGLGDDVNTDFLNAQYALSQIHHKKGMELLVPDAKPLNPDMPFGHRDFGGKWQFVMDNLGADASGNVIANKRRNKGQFISDFKYYVRPMHYEFLEAFFHMREMFCVPQISPCSPSPGYPSQEYSSSLPYCPLPSAYAPLYGSFPGGVPTGTQDGPVPQPPTQQPANGPDY